MKIDLCKIFGVEEGEEFRFDRLVDDIYIVKNNKLFRKYSHDSEFEISRLLINEIFNFTVIKLPKKKFTDDELLLFKKVNKEYEWCARDKNGMLYLYEKKPYKKGDIWYHDISESFNCYNHLFNSILWKDEEPVFIDDYVERKDVD